MMIELALIAVAITVITANVSLVVQLKKLKTISEKTVIVDGSRKRDTRRIRNRVETRLTKYDTHGD